MTQKQEDRAGEAGNSLDDLFDDAMLAKAAKNEKRARAVDPSIRNALDAATKKMRELYTLPENWEAKRGIALIDRTSSTLIGNFRELVHKSLAGTRRLVREHTPIVIDATEYCEGYLGEVLEQRIRGRSWTEQHRVVADLWLDELMVGSPAVQLTVFCHLGAIQRVVLEDAVQFASISGESIMMLPAGTDLFFAMSEDSKRAVRKAVRS